jgi:hypothetical protein
LLLSGNLQNLELPKCHFLSNEMNIKFHMLGSPVMNWVFR